MKLVLPNSQPMLRTCAREPYVVPIQSKPVFIGHIWRIVDRGPHRARGGQK